MTILIGWGFWPSYYGPLVHGVAQTPVVLHVMASSSPVDGAAHRAGDVGRDAPNSARIATLGKVGIGYGVLLLLVGCS